MLAETENVNPQLARGLKVHSGNAVFAYSSSRHQNSGQQDRKIQTGTCAGGLLPSSQQTESPLRNSRPGQKKARGSGGSSMGSSKRMAVLPEKKAPFKPKKLLTMPANGNVVVKKLKVQKFKSGGLGRKS